MIDNPVVAWLVGVTGSGATGYTLYRLARLARRNVPVVKSIARAIVREFAASDPVHGNGSIRGRIDEMHSMLRTVSDTTVLILREQADQRRDLREHAGRLASLEGKEN